MQPSFFQGVVGGERWKVRKAWFGGNFSSEEATTAERASACCKQITPVIERWNSLRASAAGTVRVCPRWRAVDPIVACALVVGATRAVAIAAIGTVRLDASQ